MQAMHPRNVMKIYRQEVHPVEEAGNSARVVITINHQQLLEEMWSTWECWLFYILASCSFVLHCHLGGLLDIERSVSAV